MLVEATVSLRLTGAAASTPHRYVKKSVLFVRVSLFLIA
jgi:hypothetical protein